MDAAHFVQGAVLGMVWCFVRLFIASPSGRQRFNVLGALNAVTKEVLTITNETYIHSESVCLLLAKIAAHYAGKPITVFLDNARYQCCQLVQEYAAALGITLAFLPSYSPHLNLIERYWRFVRKTCLYSMYYELFADFKNAISQLIGHSPHPTRLCTGNAADMEFPVLLRSPNLSRLEYIPLSTPSFPAMPGGGSGGKFIPVCMPVCMD